MNRVNSKLSTAFSIAFLLWFVCYVVTRVMHDFTLQTFYGSGNYSRFVGSSYPSGNKVNVENILGLRAVFNHTGTYECPGIVVQDGKPDLSFTTNGHPICCPLVADQTMVPFKINNDVVHFMCGRWPFNHEVLLKDIPVQLQNLQDDLIHIINW